MGYYSSYKLSLICLPIWLFWVSVSSYSSSMSHWIYLLTMSKLWTRAYNSRAAVAGLLASPCNAGALHFLWILVQVLISVMKADSAGYLQLEDGGWEAMRDWHRFQHLPACPVCPYSSALYVYLSFAYISLLTSALEPHDKTRKDFM